MTVALIVAAGSGERLGARVPKALVELAGRTLLQWSIEAIAGVGGVDRIVVALPRGTRAPLPPGVTAVEGGAVRSDSVKRALGACAEGEVVLVHDAARPLLTPELAASVLAALAGDETADAAVAAAPVSDTVKQVQPGSDVVSRTLDRRGLWAVQTPQVFRRGPLERALAVPQDVLAQATDDAWLIERAGGKVIVVPASAENIKVTTPLDLEVAELLLARRLQAGDLAAAGGANPA
jgi:2-C-methyl-D-erythritol 4-phosphate cytidylyltransferase